MGTARGRKLIPPGVVPALAGGTRLTLWHSGHHVLPPSVWSFLNRLWRKVGAADGKKRGKSAQAEWTLILKF